MNGLKEQVTRSLTPELAAQLEASWWPPLDSRMPPAEPGIRLKTSPLLRRLMPTRLVVARAERRGRALWEESPAERADAIATMELIVAGTPRERELEQLAGERLVENAAHNAIYWQPWPVPDLDDASAAHLDEALSGERGVLISACHLGPYYSTMLTMPPRGICPFAVSGEWYFEPASHDLWGRRLARWRRDTVCVCVPARGSFPLLRALLEQGHVVLVYFDMPGHHETSFLGKRAMLADGCARLAMDAGAVVLCQRAGRDGHRVTVEMTPALDPRDFASADELHAHLARQHERWILEHPEAMDDPRSFGWEDGVSPDAWLRPTPPPQADAESAGRA